MQVLTNLNFAFVALFVSEVVLKVMGLTWQGYWRQGWNRFDFVMSLISLVDASVVNLNFSFVRVFRLVRLVKLVRTFKVRRGSCA